MSTRPASSVVNPNLGLYLDRPPIALTGRMLQDGYNFRVQNGKLSNLNLGWTRFGSFTLNGSVLLIFDFLRRDGTDILVFGTKTDLYKYNTGGGGSVSYITPIYATGTASVSGTAVTGIGTDWDPNVKAGDEISFGSANRVDPTATWFTILTRNTDTSLTLTSSAGVIGAGVYTIRKKFTGAEIDTWIPEVFVNAQPANADELWLTNGVDDIVKWDGVTSQVVAQTAFGFQAKTLSVYQNMMIFGNLIQGGTAKPTDIINSDVGQPGVVSGGLSEQFKVHGGVDEIEVLEPLGDGLAIYSKATVTVAQFVGDPLVFVFRNAITGTGAISRRAVANFGNYHEFLGRGSQFIFDGATVKEIGKQAFREALRAQDPVRTRDIYHHFDEENGDLVWSIPATTDPGAGTAASAPARAFVEHWLEEVGPNIPNPVSLRAFPFTATGYYARTSGLTWADLTGLWSTLNFRWNDQFFFASFPLNMAGDTSGKLYTFGTSQNADGAALASYVRFGRKAISDGRMRGMVRRVYPFVTAFSTTLDVTTRLTDNAMGPITITQTDSFDQTLPEGGHFVSPFRRGRFVENQFGTAGPGQPWELSGYDMDLTSGGKR